MKNNLIKYKLLNICKNKERVNNLYKFYYKCIITYKEKSKCRNIFEIRKENYGRV